jgi:heat shock protein 5
VIGIDLGSTFSRVAIYESDSPIYKSGKANLIPNANGQRASPSQSEERNSFEARKTELAEMKKVAEAYLGREVKSAVVTVPAHYDEAQRQVMQQAAELGGLDVLRVLSEPIAAALALNLHNFVMGEMNAVIFDQGGSSLDVTLLTIDSGMFEVRATKSSKHLGGQVFNKRVLGFMVEQLKEKTGIALETRQHENKAQWFQLHAEVERAKRALSSATSTSLSVDVNSTDTGEEERHTVALTRAEFEEMNQENMTAAVSLIQDVLDEAGVAKEEVLKVVLVGGSSSIPKMKELILAEVSVLSACMSVCKMKELILQR